MIADDLITVPLIELVRRMIGNVSIQHHDFAALPVRVALYPVHKLLTDTARVRQLISQPIDIVSNDFKSLHYNSVSC